MFWSRYGKTLSIWIVIGGMLFTGLTLTVFAPYQVESVSLTPHDVQREAFGVGTVEAKVVVSVGSKITNRITALTVDQGDRVHAGQLLATLEDQDFKKQVAQAERDLDRAAADVVANQAAIKKAAADLTLARKNYERYRALIEEEVVSQLAFEQKENEHIAAQEGVNALRAQRTALEKQQKKARAAVDFAKARLADTRVYAPCDGIVVSREAEAGDTVVAGASLFRIADTSIIWIRAHIDETVAGDIQVGQTASVVLRSQPDQRLAGHVARVEVESDRVTEEKAVNVTFPMPSTIPPIGEQAEVSIVTAQKTQAPALPRQAVMSTTNTAGVWLIQDGRVYWREVQVGIVDPSGWVEIVSGVDGKDKVAVASLDTLRRLTENSRITVQNGRRP
jgi:HlyD family secretion protein